MVRATPAPPMPTAPSGWNSVALTTAGSDRQSNAMTRFSFFILFPSIVIISPVNPGKRQHSSDQTRSRHQGNALSLQSRKHLGQRIDGNGMGMADCYACAFFPGQTHCLVKLSPDIGPVLFIVQEYVPAPGL